MDGDDEAGRVAGARHEDDMAATRRIGIIGFGTIGRAILAACRDNGLAEVGFVLGRPSAAPPEGLAPELFVTDLDAALARPVDLIVEAAVADVLTRNAERLLASADVLGLSCTALADAATEATIRAACTTHRRRWFVPHGAVLALDGLADGRDAIESVVITTTKSGKSLGVDPDTDGVLYDGPTRGACGRFPRNVNVHAAVALAGIGFDRTISRVVAKPGHGMNEHHIAVAGDGIAWDIRVASPSLGGVTAAYTPRSAIGSIRRILGGAGVTIA
jgi:aspartate dehydrogenase